MRTHLIVLAAAAAFVACSNARPLATGSGACSGCHGNASNAAPPTALNGATLTTDLAVGAHQAHLTDGPLRKAIACSECHVVPDRVESPGHIEGKPARIVFGPIATADGATPAWHGRDATNATPTCSSTYCHGAFPRGNASNAPTWTLVGAIPGEARCGSCHGLPPPSPHPSVTVTGGDLSVCAGCHDGTVRPDGTIDVEGGLHVNGQVDGGAHGAGWYVPVTGGDHAVAAKDGTSGGLSQCTSCHGVDLAGGSSSISCAECHADPMTSCTFCHGGLNGDTSGAPPYDTHRNTASSFVGVGAHAKHLTTTGSDTTKQQTANCSACHVRPADALASGHIDEASASVPFPNGSLARAASATPVYNGRGTTAASCSSTYCHGGFAHGSYATPLWTGTAACGSCHPTSPTSGEHSRHLGISNVDCGTCHGAGYGASTVAGATHVNGGVELSPSGITVSRSSTLPGSAVSCTGTCHNHSHNDSW